MNSTTRITLSCLLFTSPAPLLRADLPDVIDAFREVRKTTIFPVEGKTFDDIEETFGPRQKPGDGNRYDWHRGIDIDGVGGEKIRAVYPGTYEGLRNSTSGGNYVVLKHSFPSTATLPILYGPNPDQNRWSTFYTYYLHLDDKTLPLVQDWVIGRPVQRGELIGYLGSTGTSAPHLHFELRFGSSNSLEAQINFGGLSTTDAWFDPHMHPMLLFRPDSSKLRNGSTDKVYQQRITELQSLKTPTAPAVPGRYFLYTSTLDELPILNRLRVDVLKPGSTSSVKRFALDLNTRRGFDATTNVLLDSRNFEKPYIEPLPFSDDQRTYRTRLVVPTAWLGELTSHRLRITAVDIWGRVVRFTTSE